MNKMLEELIVKEYINIVKELKDMNESNMEGIINLSKDNMMSNLELVQDFSKTKQKCFSRNKSVNSIDIDISDINFLFEYHSIYRIYIEYV